MRQRSQAPCHAEKGSNLQARLLVCIPSGRRLAQSGAGACSTMDRVGQQVASDGNPGAPKVLVSALVVVTTRRIPVLVAPVLACEFIEAGAVGVADAEHATAPALGFPGTAYRIQAAGT